MLDKRVLLKAQSVGGVVGLAWAPGRRVFRCQKLLPMVFGRLPMLN